jgi:hypothetical protein
MVTNILEQYGASIFSDKVSAMKKQKGNETHHSPPSNTEVKNIHMWSYTSTPTQLHGLISTVFELLSQP